jgi:hypothetical protein
VLLPAANPAAAAMIIGLTGTGELVRFDSAAPGTILAGPMAITGLEAFEAIQAIDFRPTTGALYGFSSNYRLFVINPATGAARLIATMSTTVGGGHFAFDFNPTVDRIRMMSDASRNVRIHPDTAAVTEDSTLSFAQGDPNFGATPRMTAAAYLNSHAGATTTFLYGIDYQLDALVTLANPNSGLITTVGPLGVDTSGVVGFDIESPTNIGFAALQTLKGSNLYSINLSTGVATSLGFIDPSIRGLAVIPPASSLVGLTTANQLIRFNANAPSTLLSGPTAITGLTAPETIVAIDYRPATGALYGLSDTGRLYTLDATTGAATLAAALSSSVQGATFGMDVNPVADRIRVVSNTGWNVRVNPGTGAVITDTPLSFTAGDPNFGTAPSITGSAYTNSFFGSVGTSLYGIDANLDALVIQNPPNGGNLATIGSLGVNVGAEVGFDIEPTLNVGWAAMQEGGTFARLYRINLTTGAATLVGGIGSSLQLRGLAVVLFGASPPATVTATGASSSQINVTFSAVTGAEYYQIYRQGAGGGFTLAGTTYGLQFNDTTVAAEKSYLYRVRAFGTAGNAAPDSGVDLGLAMAFNDDPLIATITAIKALHVTQMRTAVNATRELAGLSPASFTDASPAGVTVKAAHVTELRSALDPARALLGLAAQPYSRTLVAGSTIVAAVDVSELRNGVK